MFKKTGKDALYIHYEDILPSGKKIKVLYASDLEAVELFIANQNGTYDDQPVHKFVEGQPNKGCPDSDFATYRPRPIPERDVGEIVEALGGLPSKVRGAIYDGNKPELMRYMAGG